MRVVVGSLIALASSLALAEAPQAPISPKQFRALQASIRSDSEARRAEVQRRCDQYLSDPLMGPAPLAPETPRGLLEGGSPRDAEERRRSREAYARERAEEAAAPYCSYDAVVAESEGRTAALEADARRTFGAGFSAAVTAAGGRLAAALQVGGADCAGGAHASLAAVRDEMAEWLALGHTLRIDAPSALASCAGWCEGLARSGALMCEGDLRGAFEARYAAGPYRNHDASACSCEGAASALLDSALSERQRRDAEQALAAANARAEEEKRRVAAATREEQEFLDCCDPYKIQAGVLRARFSGEPETVWDIVRSKVPAQTRGDPSRDDLAALRSDVLKRFEERRAERAARLREVFAERERLAAKLRAQLRGDLEDSEWTALRGLDAAALHARSVGTVATLRAALPALKAIPGASLYERRQQNWAEANCFPDDPDVCLDLAKQIFFSPGVVTEEQAAAASTYVQVACLEGRSSACYVLTDRGSLYRAIGYELPRCVNGDDGACSNVGAVFSGVALGGSKATLKHALAFYDTACEGGHKRSCSASEEVRTRQAIPGRRER